MKLSPDYAGTPLDFRDIRWEVANYGSNVEILQSRLYLLAPFHRIYLGTHF